MFYKYFKISIGLVLIGITIAIFYYGWNKFSTHRVENIVLSSNLSFQEKEQITEIISPFLQSGYYSLDVSHLINEILKVGWIAKVEIKKKAPFTLQVNIIKDQLFFFFNENQFINQFLKVKNLTKEQKKEYQNQLPHLFSQKNQLNHLVSFYNELYQKFEEVDKNYSINIKEMQINATEQLVVNADLKTLHHTFSIEIIFGRKQIKEKINSFISEIKPIADELIKHKQNSRYLKYKTLLDLRFPKGFSLEEIAQ